MKNMWQTGCRRVSGMTKDDCAKVMAVKYVLDYNTFRRSDRLKGDLVEARIRYGGDEEFDRLFRRYCDDLREKEETPRWARLIMAERYSLNV